ncbi:hypothetical protein GGI04_004417 [Coemansia thaxteri]|nr:hypothetical protein GGI04_004417 [Coemansia thaxteri]
MLLIGGASPASLRNDGIVVVSLAPSAQIQHIFNGRLVDPASGECAHLHQCDWDPFAALETPAFFRTFIAESPDAYTVTVSLPSFISRYIRVQPNTRTVAIVAKAMARRQWADTSDHNVHELWKVYWRLFRVPVHCDLKAVRALYGSDELRVVVPRRSSPLFRAINWAEERLWVARRSMQQQQPSKG